MSEIIQDGKVVTNAGVTTIIYKYNNSEYRIGLSKGWHGKGNNEWIITAYQRNKSSAQNFDQDTTTR